jgi:hypothetical protein
MSRWLREVERGLKAQPPLPVDGVLFPPSALRSCGEDGRVPAWMNATVTVVGGSEGIKTGGRATADRASLPLHRFASPELFPRAGVADLTTAGLLVPGSVRGCLLKEDAKWCFRTFVNREAIQAASCKG